MDHKREARNAPLARVMGVGRQHQQRDYKGMGEMTVVQGLLDVANTAMEAAWKKQEACRKKRLLTLKGER